MPTKRQVVENIKWTTSRISDRIWTISVGVVAMSLTYIVESASGDGEPFLEPRQVAIPAGLALLALTSDLIQYVVATRQDQELLRRMESEGLEEAKYKVSSPLRRMRTAAYRAKFALCIVATIWIVALSARRAFELF